MKPHQKTKVTAVFVLCLAGLLSAIHFNSESIKTVAPKINVRLSGAIPAADGRSQMALSTQATKINSIMGPPVMPPLQQPVSWSDQLVALLAMGELFGMNGEQRLTQLQDFVAGLEKGDLPIAIRKIQELQANTSTATEIGHCLQLRLLQRWAESDIRAAENWTTQIPAGSDREDALAVLASAWAGQNFAEAIAWSDQFPEGTEQQRVRQSVADAVVYLKPVDALRAAVTLPADAMRDDIIARATGVWAATAPEEAASWAKQIPDSTLREEVTASIATTWGASDPVAAGDLAVNSLQPGLLQDAAVTAIVERWGLSDPQRAKAWVKQFPAGPLRQAATAALEDIESHEADPENQGSGKP